MNAIFENSVVEFIGNYFENYKNTGYYNDLNLRTLRVRRIREFLNSLDISKAYMIDNKNFIEIPEIAIIQFSLKPNGTDLLVEEIYFID